MESLSSIDPEANKEARDDENEPAGLNCLREHMAYHHRREDRGDDESANRPANSASA